MAAPPHLLATFDPNKSKVAELRGILLQHDVPFPSNAKKPDLVKLYEAHIRPQAPTLLAQLSAVRPSTQGILDGESVDGSTSLRELDTDSEQEREFEAQQRAKKGGRKSVGGRRSVSGRRSVVGVAKGAGKGKERATSEPEEEEEVIRLVEPAFAKGRRKSGRKPSVAAPPAEVEVEVTSAEEEEEEQALQSESSLSEAEEEVHISPRKRKATGEPSTSSSATPRPRPRLSEILKAQDAESPAPRTESGFSDYNPFQSGGEETPGRERERDVKRQKSSLGPSRLSSRKSLSSLAPTSAAPSSAARKSLPSSVSTSRLSSASGVGEWAPSPSSSSKKKHDVPPPVPPIPARHALARTSSTSDFFAAPTSSSASGAGAARSRFSAGPSASAAVATGREAGPSSARKRKSAPAAAAGAGMERKRAREPSPELEQEVEVQQEQEEEQEHDYPAELAPEFEMRDVSPEPEMEVGQQQQEEEEDEDVSMDVEVEASPPAALPPPAAAPAPQPRPQQPPQQQRSSLGGAGTGTGTPVGRKFMVPASEVKRTPPEVARLLREAGRIASPPSPPSVGQGEREGRAGRRSEPAAAAAGSGSGTPRRSLPVAPERERERVVVRGAPAPPTPGTATKAKAKAKKRSSLASAVSFPTPLTTSTTSEPFFPPNLARALRPLLLLALLAYAAWYRAEKVAAGFCDSSPSPSSSGTSAGSGSNYLVLSRAQEGQTSLSLPSLPDLPRPVLSFLDSAGLRPSCLPCPSHGACSHAQFQGCEADYVPRPSLLSTLSGGLIPGRPRCEADTEKQVAVAKGAASALRVLRRRRGEVVCKRKIERGRRREAKGLNFGEEGVEGREEAMEAFVYGLEAERVLGALVAENEASPAPFPPDVLDEINRLALRDLELHGEVWRWENGDTYWYASKTAEMPLSCRARLATIRSAKKHKTGLAGTLLSLSLLLYGRFKLQQRKEDKERVKQLVQAALRLLQQQERSHHLSPSSTPYPHLPPAHLRDLLLTSIHSPTRRASLWRAVEKVVEGNANVRVAEVEVGGEEMRGWRWVGPTREEGDGEGRDEGKEMVQLKGVGTPLGTPVK
ncbi:hypothetical protein JCM10213_007811 [Rhodosporidiobolus nylandii]